MNKLLKRFFFSLATFAHSERIAVERLPKSKTDVDGISHIRMAIIVIRMNVIRKIPFSLHRSGQRIAHSSSNKLRQCRNDFRHISLVCIPSFVRSFFRSRG